jgi:hypothetical protein
MCSYQTYRTADPLAPTPLWPEEPKKKEKKDEPGIEFQEEYFR